MLYALVVLCLFSNVLARIIFEDGPCPEMKVVPDFNVSRYMGKWYGVLQAVRRSRSYKRCVTHDLTLDPSNRTISEIYSYIYCTTGVMTLAPMVLRIIDSDEAAKMERKPLASPDTDKYWILETDYDSYSMVYNCLGSDIEHGKEIMFFIRNLNMVGSLQPKFFALIKKYKLQELAFETIGQVDCVPRPCEYN